MRAVWFKAKTYGWGWTPATWQGWAVMLMYVTSVVFSAFAFLMPRANEAGWIAYGISLAALTALLIVICYKTGEEPHWRWGDRGRN